METWDAKNSGENSGNVRSKRRFRKNIRQTQLEEAEKRKHEYVTIEHVLLALIKDQHIGTTLTEFKIDVGALIKDVEDYLDTKCT